VLAADSSDVAGKGRSGETCRPRYAIELHAMTGGTFKITKEETRETLNNFKFKGVIWPLRIGDTGP
jgi:hypothetical protein